MFLCPKCKNKMTLPACSCGYTARQQNMIWQLSDMPDIVIDGDGDKYLDKALGGAEEAKRFEKITVPEGLIFDLRNLPCH